MRLAKLSGARALVPLLALFALGAGLSGCSGDDGKDGAAGPAGPAGPPGPTGDPGASGTTPDVVVTSAKPESCGTCHAGTGVEHEDVYKNYLDSSNKNMKLAGMTMTTTGAGPYTVTLKFSVTNQGVPVDDLASTAYASPGQRTFYFVAYDSVSRKFDGLAAFPITAVTPGTDLTKPKCPIKGSSGAWTLCSDLGLEKLPAPGEYQIVVKGSPYDPTGLAASFPVGTTGAFAYGYVAPAANALVVKGNYKLYSDFASTAVPYGDAGAASPTKYVSTANVAACESCHGKPYQKHGYREAQVANLPDFVACKSCHFDSRTGSDHVWQQMLDDPYAWATGVAPDTVKYAYTANVMNDVHMSHAMEFPYPQSMANCNTCHAGKLHDLVTAGDGKGILSDANFTATTCKSCHAVDGKDAWEGQKYDETKRAPALKELWTAKNLGFHQITDDCKTCHRKDGVAGQFTAYHTGYDAMIYDAAGVKYNTLYKAQIDAVSFNATTNVLNIKFSATNPATKPVVAVSFYGYDTKDFYISGHNADGHAGTDATNGCYSSRSAKWGGCTLEYTAGANLNDVALRRNTTRDNNLLFTRSCDRHAWRLGSER